MLGGGLPLRRVSWDFWKGLSNFPPTAPISKPSFTESIPAFLTIVLIPLSINITEGIALGFIFFALLKLVSGRAKECHWIIYSCAVAFIIRNILMVRS